MLLGTPGGGKSNRERGRGAMVAWWRLSYQDVVQIRSGVIARDLAASRVNAHLTALRGVLAESLRLGYLTPDEHARLTDFRNVPRTGPVNRSALAAEVDRMLAACAADPGVAGIRDAAIIAAMSAVGGRRDVVNKLMIEDYDRQTGVLAITSRGGRTASVPGHLAVYVDRWLDQLGEQDGPMFRPVTRGGHIRGPALSELSISHTLVRRRRAADLPTLASHEWRVIFSEDALHPDPGTSGKR